MSPDASGNVGGNHPGVPSVGDALAKTERNLGKARKMESLAGYEAMPGCFRFVHSAARLSGLRDHPNLMTKILLVEDNEMNRDMLSRRLLRKGYDVIRPALHFA